MIEPCWAIDISLPARQIEQQIIAIVEELDELGVFALLRQTAAANDNAYSFFSLKVFSQWPGTVQKRSFWRRWAETP